MFQAYIKNPRKLMQNKKLIEREFKAKITREKEAFIFDTSPEQDIILLEFVEAINLGFTIPKALFLKEENVRFEKINIKDETKKKGLEKIRGRIIGTHGKAIETLEGITDCYIKLNENTIGIIGLQEDVMYASNAIRRLIRGSKHGKVYGFIEKQMSEDRKKL